jgi:hypothetical protein
MDYSALKGAQDEIIIEGLSIASNGIIPAIQFMILYAMVHNIGDSISSSNNNILLNGIHISYSGLSTMLRKAQTGYVHPIAD